MNYTIITLGVIAVLAIFMAMIEAIVILVLFMVMIQIPQEKNPNGWIHDYPEETQEDY